MERHAQGSGHARTALWLLSTFARPGRVPIFPVRLQAKLGVKWPYVWWCFKSEDGDSYSFDLQDFISIYIHV
jgi:hypothetical protein